MQNLSEQLLNIMEHYECDCMTALLILIRKGDFI